jgi:hypothetical protein
MRPDTLTTLHDPRLLEARNAWFDRMRGLFAGQHQEQAFVLHGIGTYTEDDGPDWERWLDGSLDKIAEHAAKSLDRDVFRPLFINYNPHGVHFIDYLLGADVFTLDDSWQVHTLEAPVGTLEQPNLEELPGWQVMKDFSQAFLERDVPAVLFGLPTIASVLNIAVNLYGGRILMAMVTDPEAAHHDLQVIGDVLCAIHRWYLDNIPLEQMQCIIPGGRCQPPGYGQLCGCTTHLISREHYAELVAPLDDALLSLYPHGGMIHLCGAHAQHVPVWREMASLRSVQMNDRAAEDLDLYFNELRQDQIMYVNPCEGMPIDRVMRITNGQRVVVVADVQEPLPAAA